jgi:hypothetical protein
MEKRQPCDLKYTMMFYNLVQVILNTLMATYVRKSSKFIQISHILFKNELLLLLLFLLF